MALDGHMRMHTHTTVSAVHGHALRPQGRTRSDELASMRCMFKYLTLSEYMYMYIALNGMHAHAYDTN